LISKGVDKDEIKEKNLKFVYQDRIVKYFWLIILKNL
jgi:hypothetical protein